MFDWIFYVVMPMLLVGLVALVAALALTICAAVFNYVARREARVAAEAEAAGADAADTEAAEAAEA